MHLSEPGWLGWQPKADVRATAVFRDRFGSIANVSTQVE
jgi:hypothetical protein